jgi:hypothetical protein
MKKNFRLIALTLVAVLALAQNAVNRANGVNAQTGTTYTVLDGDRAKLVTLSNASAVAVTLPQAGASSSFIAGWFADLQNRGAGTVTITPTTSTIDGAASLNLTQNQGVRVFSDGTNYFTQRGIGGAGGTGCVPSGSSGQFLTDNGSGACSSEASFTTTTVATASSTTTFTNKTVDAEGTGNSITIPVKIWFDAVATSGGTTGALNFDTLASQAPTATSSAGSTNTELVRGVADYADSGTFQMMRQFMLPSDWTGNIDAILKWRTAATSGNVVWQIATVCIADGEVDDANWNSASTVTDAAKGTTLQLNDAAITSITATGCAAGELMHFRVLRDPTNGSDNLGATASLVGVELTLRRAM